MTFVLIARSACSATGPWLFPLCISHAGPSGEDAAAAAIHRFPRILAYRYNTAAPPHTVGSSKQQHQQTGALKGNKRMIKAMNCQHSPCCCLHEHWVGGPTAWCTRQARGPEQQPAGLWVPASLPSGLAELRADPLPGGQRWRVAVARRGPAPAPPGTCPQLLAAGRATQVANLYEAWRHLPSRGGLGGLDPAPGCGPSALLDIFDRPLADTGSPWQPPVLTPAGLMLCSSRQQQQQQTPSASSMVQATVREPRAVLRCQAAGCGWCQPAQQTHAMSDSWYGGP